MTRMELKPPDGYMDDPLSWQIRWNLANKKNTMVAALGRVRSGKSTALMMFGEMNDARHDFDTSHVAFEPADYLQKISTFKRGCFVLFDEPGAEWSARRFMSISNVMLSATHITFGSRLVNVGWAVPNLKMQDINAARLLNYYFIMQQPPHPVGSAVLYRNWVDEYTGNTGRNRLGTVVFAFPFQRNPEEYKRYEQMKKEYQNKRYEEYYIRFAEQNKKLVETKTTTMEEINEIVKTIVKDPRTYILSGRIRAELIQATHNVKPAEARQIKLLVEKFFADSHIDLKTVYAN